MPLPHLPALAAVVLAIVPSHAVVSRTQPATTLQQTDADAARLLPPGAILVARLESVEALRGLVDRLSTAEGDASPDAEQMLMGLGLPGDVGLVDATRPLWLALTTSAEMPMPMPTYVVAVGDGKVYGDSVEGEGGWTVASAGDLVGVSRLPGYAAQVESSPRVAALKPGLVSMHVELATLIQIFRMSIDNWLTQAEMMLDSVAQMSGSEVDIRPLLELYLDMARDLVDSAETLDLTFSERDASLELSGWLSTLEKSPMAAWGAGEPVDLRGWPAQVDANASLSMAMGGDWGSLMKRMQPLMDASFAMYPAETRKFFQDYMAACEPLFGLMGPAFAGGQLGDQGMRMGYVVRSPKPAELVEAMSAILQRFSGGDSGLGVTITAPQTVQVGGIEARRFRMDIDYDAMASAMGEELGEDQRQKMSAAMAALYGPGGLTFTLAPTEGAVVAAFGGDDAFAERVLTAPAGAARGVPADLKRALEAASGGGVGLVYRIDLGQLVEEFGAMAAALGQTDTDLGFLPTSSLPITSWMGIRGRTWSGGLSLDADALVAYLKAASGPASDKAAEPLVFEVTGPEDAAARASVVQAELALIEAALQLYSINNAGHYPDSLDELVAKDENGQSYLDELPLDPWQNPYVYEPPAEPGGRCRLLCYGSDGQPGGEGEAADVVEVVAEGK